ncbi:MAG: dephospho-CoA kinase [Candidatus Omnitrophota bacterium]|jgi:dephospho-CoA kinase|nr:dephospho-CoA kinase [Candidatus Omnitrophota bacterium]
MRIVGLTGGFGSGKSFVASLFKSLGAKVVDADKLGHRAMKRGSVVYRKIVAAFGKNILKSDLSINRKALAGIVFANKKDLARLNDIIHPGIIREITGRIRTAAKNEVLIVDAPLICETNITGLMNVLIVVKASKKNQMERSSRKFCMKTGDVRKRIAMQMPLNKKIRMADYIVDNNGTRKDTKKQVRKIWQELKKGA